MNPTQHKTTGVIIGIAVILIGGIIAFAQHANKKTVEYTPSTSAPQETTNPNTVTPTPDKPVATAPAPNTYTRAVVATHNTPTDCWTTINGSVYNVTSWIAKHPGGAKAIISLCGIDGSPAFNGQHGGQKRPASELASFKIGTLTQ